ncbi:MAG: transporter [Chloroflexi bacterium]|nr:transporter [Chloroflexota bacterium]
MIEFLVENPLFMLFLIAAIGYPLGHIKVKGSSLGVAAILFVGLAVGALDPNLKLPEVLSQLGLVIFVYTIGLSSGPGFFASLRRKGLRDNLFIVLMLLLGVALTMLVTTLLSLKPTVGAGMFSGSFTNTPALASVLDYIKSSPTQGNLEQLLTEPVVGYSVTYPMGVIGVILAIVLTQRLLKINYAQEAKTLPQSEVGRELQNRTVRITRPEATQKTIGQFIKEMRWDVVFGRLQHQHHQSLLSSAQSRFEVGDLVSIIGTAEELDRVVAYLGEPSDEKLELDRSELDYRRIFVSDAKVTGHSLRDLNLPQHFGALVTRLRRGDVDFLPHGDTILQLGDRVRVVAPRDHMDAISKFFGDSYRALSEIDFMTFSFGLALGMLLGQVPIPLPGGVIFKFGLAGGPLLVAMFLGRIGRTGPLVWTLPYSANLTLRQVGLILFLAAVGTRSGYAFVDTLTQGNGLTIFAAGAFVTFTVAMSTLWIGYKLLKIPLSILIGMLAGLGTQPAVLGFATEQTENDLPNLGYTAVYPTATIAKIILAQLLLVALQ